MECSMWWQRPSAQRVGFSTVGWLDLEQAEKKTISYRKSGEIREKSGVGVWEVWEAIFIVHFKKRVAHKLRRITLLHLGLITLRIHFRKTRKPFIFMIFIFSDVSMTLKTNYFKLWRHQMTPSNQIIFGGNIMGNLKILELQHFVKCLEMSGWSV